MHVEGQNIFITSHYYELQIVKDLLMWSYDVTNQHSANLMCPFQKQIRAIILQSLSDFL